MTFVPFSFSIPKNKKQGSLCPSEKVLVAKIDLHENEWVYCNKPHIYIYIYILDCYYLLVMWVADMPYPHDVT